jgi:hypothetical protein
MEQHERRIPGPALFWTVSQWRVSVYRQEVFSMKDLEEEIAEGAGPRREKSGITASARKVAANRQNAQKSTGPKTTKGKVYSGRNAIKHGLFTRQLIDFANHGEDSQEYELRGGLRAQYQPIGTAEELEVERLALCWWRLKRAWRYENAVNCVALQASAGRELATQRELYKQQDKKDQSIILQLKTAADEIEEKGEISREMKDRIFAIDPGIESMWESRESEPEEKVADPTTSKMWQDLSSEERSSIRAVSTVYLRIDFIEQVARLRSSADRENAIAKHVIPKDYELNRLLRYETAIERQLGRTVDRLERLQRRRQGEMIPPPVSVHLTR